MEYLHPILGTATLVLLYWLTNQSLRARHRKPYAPKARRLHARVAPWAYVLMLLAALGGTLSTALLRDDLELADSWHFVVGWTAAVAMTIGAITSRWNRQNKAIRTLHLVVGLLALAATTAVSGLGLEMLP